MKGVLHEATALVLAETGISAAHHLSSDFDSAGQNLDRLSIDLAGIKVVRHLDGYVVLRVDPQDYDTEE